MIWKINNRPLDLTHHAQVMGILNTTPDSFTDGGRFLESSKALAHAMEMITQGAAIIDVGGESTRPGAPPVGVDEEIARTIPVIRGLREKWDGYISIDTRKAVVAAVALEAGANIVNDVSGLTADPDMQFVCANSDCGIVIMHMRGTPENMQVDPHYENVVTKIHAFFEERLESLLSLGIEPARLCFDPGIGFGKTRAHNLSLLRHIDSLAPSGYPLLLGLSRKSFLSKITAAEQTADRDAPTIALTAIARKQGIMLHRVHDVQGNLAALRATEALLCDEQNQ